MKESDIKLIELLLNHEADAISKLSNTELKVYSRIRLNKAVYLIDMDDREIGSLGRLINVKLIEILPDPQRLKVAVLMGVVP